MWSKNILAHQEIQEFLIFSFVLCIGMCLAKLVPFEEIYRPKLGENNHFNDERGARVITRMTITTSSHPNFIAKTILIGNRLRLLPGSKYGFILWAHLLSTGEVLWARDWYNVIDFRFKIDFYIMEWLLKIKFRTLIQFLLVYILIGFKFCIHGVW